MPLILYGIISVFKYQIFIVNLGITINLENTVSLYITLILFFIFLHLVLGNYGSMSIQGNLNSFLKAKHDEGKDDRGIIKESEISPSCTKSETVTIINLIKSLSNKVRRFYFCKIELFQNAI